MQENLIKLGLSENEARVYVAVLGLGIAPASAIAAQAQIKRPTTYLVLEHLVKQGLVSEVVSGKEKKFKAENPDRLAKLTRKMRRKVIEAEIGLENLLPGLRAIQKKLIETPKVIFYQGMEGLKAIAEEASAYPEPWYYFGSSQEWLKVLSAEGMEQLILDMRVFRHKINSPTVYVITDENYRKVRLFKKDEPQIRRVKIFPELAKVKSAFAIYGNKLALINISSAPFGAILESGEITELVKMMFMVIWKSLPEEKGETGKKGEQGEIKREE